MYWIMGNHTSNDIYRNITKIGFFNPRQNKSYVLETEKISSDIIKTVETEVICYD
jgi:hypothetical protein